MSIFLNKDSKVIVQGITGDKGTFHAKEMLDYGSNVVGGLRGANTMLPATPTKTIKF